MYRNIKKINEISCLDISQFAKSRFIIPRFLITFFLCCDLMVLLSFTKKNYLAQQSNKINYLFAQEMIRIAVILTSTRYITFYSIYKRVMWKLSLLFFFLSDTRSDSISNCSQELMTWFVNIYLIKLSNYFNFDDSSLFNKIRNKHFSTYYVS